MRGHLPCGGEGLGGSKEIKKNNINNPKNDSINDSTNHKIDRTREGGENIFLYSHLKSYLASL